MDIKITTEYITLGQLLKLGNYIQSGAEAKFVVKQIKITVNGKKEDRRGRKLYRNDKVIIEGDTLIIR